MSASDYFKVAASNIRRAIDFKRTEINNIRSQAEIKKTELNKEVQQLQAQIQAKEADIARSQNNQTEPDKDRATKLKDVSDMRANVLNLQHGMTSVQDQANSQVKNLEQELMGLDQLASSLENRT